MQDGILPAKGYCAISAEEWIARCHTGRETMKIWTICAIIGILWLCGAAAAVPPMPSEFFGDLNINGNPAPAGTEIRALVGSEERGMVISSVAGTYGGTETFDERLVVTLAEDEIGETIRFTVNGHEAPQTAVATPGDVQRIDLSVRYRSGVDPVASGGGSTADVGTATATPSEELPDEPETVKAGEEESSASDAGVPAAAGAEASPDETGGEAEATESSASAETPLRYAPFIALGAVLLIRCAHFRRD
jgi:hypothetical protein